MKEVGISAGHYQFGVFFLLDGFNAAFPTASSDLYCHTGCCWFLSG
jgi:hypothetical protein